MDIVFTQPQLLQEEFKNAMYFWAFIVVVFGVVFSARTKKVGTYVCTCLGLYVVAIGVGYAVIFSQFTQVSVDEKNITLNYTSLNGDKEKIISKNEIKDILYGSSSKINNKCHISIMTQSGTRYKSSNISAKPEKCKQIIQQIKK